MGTDCHVLIQAYGMPSCSQQQARLTTFGRVNDEYSILRNTHFRTLRKPSRTTEKLQGT